MSKQEYDDDDEETCPICGKPVHKIGERCSYADITARTDRDSQ